jgi:hypothetical protein
MARPGGRPDGTCSTPANRRLRPSRPPGGRARSSAATTTSTGWLVSHRPGTSSAWERRSRALRSDWPSRLATRSPARTARSARAKPEPRDMRPRRNASRSSAGCSTSAPSLVVSWQTGTPSSRGWSMAGSGWRRPGTTSAPQGLPRPSGGSDGPVPGGGSKPTAPAMNLSATSPSPSPRPAKSASGSRSHSNTWPTPNAAGTSSLAGRSSPTARQNGRPASPAASPSPTRSPASQAVPASTSLPPGPPPLRPSASPSVLPTARCWLPGRWWPRTSTPATWPSAASTPTETLPVAPAASISALPEPLPGTMPRSGTRSHGSSATACGTAPAPLPSKTSTSPMPGRLAGRRWAAASAASDSVAPWPASPPYSSATGLPGRPADTASACSRSTPPTPRRGETSTGASRTRTSPATRQPPP